MKELMPLIEDDIYPLVGKIERNRQAVRAILINDKDEIGLMHIYGHDSFGPRDHFETPGGGVEDNEDFEFALKREILEETGLDIDILGYVGTISIEYNLLNRIDVENYYVAKAYGHHQIHLLEYEKQIFDKVVWFPMDEILKMFDTYKTENVGTKIHMRDKVAVSEGIKLYKDILSRM